MARPTFTRAQLRRALAIRMTMPYALRIPNGYSIPSTTGLTTTLIDTVNLREGDDYWNGQWIYIGGVDGSGEVMDSIRQIADYVGTTGTLTLDAPLSTTTSTGMNYEIHSIWNAVEMNNAINKAIQDGFPAFFDTLEDSNIVVRENKLSYDIGGLGASVVHGVWVERPSRRMALVVASSSYSVPGDVTTITFVSGNLTDVDDDWLLSCYNGNDNSEGDVLGVVSADIANIQVTVSGDHSDFLSGDKVMLYDTREQYLSWYPLKFIKFSPKEFPTTMYLSNNIDAYLGSRFKFLFSRPCAKLTSDTESTSVPEEFIMLSAMSTLYASRISDNRVDRQMFASLAAEYREQAAVYKRQNAFRGMDTEIWMEGRDIGLDEANVDGNPMAWM